jgi:prepilin-type N-terminal cleavage/methylation domain-containing protein
MGQHQTMYYRKFCQKVIGYSLLECLVVLAIIAGIVLLEVKLARAQYLNSQINFCKKHYRHILQDSRSLAIISNKTVLLKPCKQNMDWSDIICAYSQDHELIKQWQTCQNKLQIYWHGFRSHSSILFEPNILHAQNNGTLIISAKNHAKIEKIIINRLGIITNNDHQ